MRSARFERSFSIRDSSLLDIARRYRRFSLFRRLDVTGSRVISKTMIFTHGTRAVLS